jgi:dihydropteroate synthase
MSGHRHLWRLSNQTIEFGPRPLVMGIVNVTPDSFSDGGHYADVQAAVAHGLALVQEGADILDIGGESSRPGAGPVPEDEELRRVLPVVQELAGKCGVPISVDTWKAPIARACLEAGARIVNDITALTGDHSMPEVIRSARAGVILMHMQGTPATMQQNPQYADVVGDIRLFFEERLRLLADVDIAVEQTVLDPGIGFGKTRDHNLQLIARLEEFQTLGRPVCLGVSRKGFLGRLLERPIEERLAGSLAAALYAQSRGAVQIVRVHDVVQTRDAVHLYALLEGARLGTPDGPTL